MRDTSPVTAQITKLITAGITKQGLLAAVAQLLDQHPDMTSAELSQALQVATALAERRTLRPH